MPQNRLAELREAAGLSRNQLGGELDVNPRTIYRWETGESQIPDSTKAWLCDRFGVSLDHLMGREPNGNGAEVAA